MTNPGDRSGLLACVLILLSFAGGLAAAEKTMKRTEDPVIIEGKELAPLLGADLEKLSLMVWKGDGFKAVPFQVDEKDEKGGYIYDMSIEDNKVVASKTVDPDPNLDANDELIFMIFDAGDKCPGDSFPKGAQKGARLEITDPVDGAKAWAYLFSFKDNPPRSDLDYIKSIHDTARSVIRTETKNYIVEYVDNAGYYNHFSRVGPDGTESPDLSDRFKIRCVASVAFNTLHFPFAMDELLKSQVLAFKDGPIRLLSLSQGYMDGPANIRLESGQAVFTSYSNSYIVPVHLNVPIDADVLLSDFKLHGENDFNENAYGTYYYDENNPYNPDIVLDGKMSEAEKNMDYKSDHDWLVLKGPYGASVFRIVFPPEWDFINKGLYYKDNPEIADPPEDNPGLVATGFDMDGFINLKKGTYSYSFHFYFPHHFEVGDEKMILNILDRPLKVKVSSVNLENAGE